MRHSRGENAYWPRPSVSVCVSVCLSVCPLPHSYTTARTQIQLGGMVGMPCTIGRICNRCTGFVAMITCTCASLQPYALQMRISPNAKCQLVFALWHGWFYYFTCGLLSKLRMSCVNNRGRMDKRERDKRFKGRIETARCMSV